MKQLFIAFLCFCSTMLYAIDGAEMTYRCLGNNDYEITLKVYHDCAGAGMQGTPPLQVGDWVNGAITNITATVPIVLDTTYEQNQINNPNYLSACQGGTLPGMIVSVYKQTVTLSSQKPNWGIQWTSDPTDLRNTTNLTSTNDLRIQALINNQNGCHDAPQDFYEMNLRYNSLAPGINEYSFGGVPSPNYQLRYKLQAPNSSTAVNYDTDLSANKPLHLDSTIFSNITFELDSMVGELSFSGQVGRVQKSATTVRIYMVDNGTVLGFIERDMLLHLDTVSNLGVIRTKSPVTISAGILFNWDNTFKYCGGDTLIFNFDIYSPTGDTLQLSPTHTNLDQVFGPGNWAFFIQQLGGFSSRPDSVRIFVQVAINNGRVGNLPATIGFTTSSDSLAAVHTTAFRIVSGGIPKASQYVICPTINQVIQLDIEETFSDGVTIGPYSWQQNSGPPVTFSSNTSTNPTIFTPDPTSYGGTIKLALSYTLTSPISGAFCIANDELIIRYDTSLQCLPNNILLGAVVVDTNSNCIKDSSETALGIPLIMQFIGNNDTSYISTNNLGEYTEILDTGNYIVSVLPPNDFWTVCPDTQQVYVDSSSNWAIADFVLEETKTCPLLNVDINIPFLRRCFNGLIYVHYENTGTMTATNALVEVVLDTSLYYVASSGALVSQTGNKYLFNVGNLAPLEQGAFYIEVNVSCFSSLGQIHCVDAHIYPDSICLPSIPNVLITDTCILDTVHFTITNLSQPYDTMATYWLWEDTVIVDTGSVQLAIGSTTTISYPTNGSGADYQLVFGGNLANLTSASAPINCTNILNNLPSYIPYNNIPYISHSCNINIGSYDPNDKQGFPVGIDSAHYIPSNTTLDYLIRFQNTGTDTAFFINIFDTLSANLDITTLQMGASSHPYTWSLRTDTLLNQSILHITFDPIYLPDSNVNLAGSNGFVWYQISTKTGLPNFETITNSASIYFDYNAPIKTNTTLHTICDNCLPIDIQVITTHPTLDDNQKEIYKIYPNPTQGAIVVEQSESEPASLILYSLEGKILHTQQLENKITPLNLSQYPSGVYFLSINNDRESNQFKIILTR